MKSLASTLTIASLLFLCVVARADVLGQVESTRPLTPLPSHGPLGPSEVELTPYGQPEDYGAYPESGTFGIRFDPPFEAPYEVTKIRFPSFTLNGVPALFESVSLCEFDPAAGLVKLGTPIVREAPFSGSSDGMNEIFVDHVVNDCCKVFYLCFEFPAKPGTYPNDTPYLRTDVRDSELGDFGSSFNLTRSGLPIQGITGNLVGSLVCELSSENQVPQASSTTLGVNRTQSGLVLTFAPSKGVMRTDILFRRGEGVWNVVGSAGGKSSTFLVPQAAWDSLGFGYWAVQGVDRRGHRAAASNFCWATYPFSQLWEDDARRPNGRLEEAAPMQYRADVGQYYEASGVLYTAGDKDYWTFAARRGEEIIANVSGPPEDGFNDMHAVAFLYDSKGHLVSESEGPSELRYRVTWGAPSAAQEFTLLVCDAPGTTFAPNAAPRHLGPYNNYDLSVSLIANSVGAANMTPVVAGRNIRFNIEVPHGTDGNTELRVYDVHGRLVRQLTVLSASDQRVMIWDGTDGKGVPVGGGVYFASMRAGTSTATCKVTVTK